MANIPNRVLHQTALSTAAVLGVLAAACSSSPPTIPTPVFAPSTARSTVSWSLLPRPAAVPGSAADPLVGRYRLEIEAGSRSGVSCELVPDYATRRSYTADVTEVGAGYAVRLYDAAFLMDTSRVLYGCADTRLPQPGAAACHQFLLTEDAGTVAITAAAEDEWRGTEIWELLPDGFLLAIVGRANGLVRDRRIEATGAGALWYGNGLPASTVHACDVDALRFTMTPAGF